MKFTYEDLAKAMGLKVGDRIKCNGSIYIVDTDFNIREKPIRGTYRLWLLINEEFES